MLQISFDEKMPKKRR